MIKRRVYVSLPFDLLTSILFVKTALLRAAQSAGRFTIKKYFAGFCTTNMNEFLTEYRTGRSRRLLLRCGASAWKVRCMVADCQLAELRLVSVASPQRGLSALQPFAPTEKSLHAQSLDCRSPCGTAGVQGDEVQKQHLHILMMGSVHEDC